jgi:hypothetical membrane protein
VECLLKVLRVIFALIAVGLAVYALITNNYELSSYMLFFLGAMMLVMGISELKVKRKKNAIISLLASTFVIFVSIYTI